MYFPFSEYLCALYGLCLTFDGYLCDCQASQVAVKALKSIRAAHLKIPARSPDLNPTENVFHLCKASLRNEAVQKGLVFESESAFEARVVRTLQDVASAHGDRTIESMPKRIAEIVCRRGGLSWVGVVSSV